MKDFSQVSVYYLMIELFCEGSSGLLPDLQPLSIAEISDALHEKTGMEFGLDIDAWARWFLATPNVGTEKDRANFFMFLEAADIRKRITDSSNQ